MLLDRLTELGGEVQRPRRLVRFAQDDDGVTAVFDDGDTVRARFMVGTDGMRSTVREQAGIGFSGGEFAESFVLADVRLRGEAPDDQVILFWAKAGLTVVAPMPDDIYRIVAPLPDAPEAADRGAGPAVARRSRVRAGPHRGDRPGLGFPVPDPPPRGRHLPQRRLLLAGDAAHVHSPAGGQGMNLGIQDAIALADALSSTLAGSDTALDAYSAARRPIAQQVVSLTSRLTTLATLPRARPPGPQRRDRLGVPPSGGATRTGAGGCRA